jgi:hypothetical protein
VGEGGDSIRSRDALEILGDRRFRARSVSGLHRAGGRDKGTGNVVSIASPSRGTGRHLTSVGQRRRGRRGSRGSRIRG